MNKILFATLLALSSQVFAQDDKVLDSIKPPEEISASAKTAVDWQSDNNKALEQAMQDAKLCQIVKDEASAKAYLAKVKGAYLTDPMVATTIAAVSQLVVRPCTKCCQKKAREIWTKALLDTAKSATDAYVAQFCIDQLRWCASPSQADLVRQAAAGKPKEVVSLAEMAAKELEGKGIGR